MKTPVESANHSAMTGIDAPFIADMFRLATVRLEGKRQALCQLDGEIGDGDHGISMANGFAAIDRMLRKRGPAAPPELMRLAAQAFLGEVGATVGPLYASAFLEAATCLEKNAPLTLDQLGLMLSACAEGIRKRGQAQPGDKTMLDVWLPASQAAQRAARAGLPASDIARQTCDAARNACAETAALMSARGRAARLQERSIGHLDPGAVSSVEVICAICDTVLERAS
ncbi:MAG: dihydroxyacetone kinase subunit L [Natronohydrobacter sp.]|nr:dihydroxyacetone kinase subunit L [Natronohydrobacter sp.]